MVIRAVFSAVVNRLPYSDRIPTILTNVLNETDSDEEFESPMNECAQESTRERIHSKLLRNRGPITPTSASGSGLGLSSFGDGLHKVDEIDEIEYELRQRNVSKNQGMTQGQRERIKGIINDDDDLTINDLNYCDICDTIPSVSPMSINKLSEKHSRTNSSGLTRVAFVDTPITLDSLPEMSPKLFQDNILEDEKQRDLRVKQFLNDQNLKFDALINNNIEDFFKQQQDAFEEVVDPESSRGLFSKIVYGGVKEVMARISYVKKKFEQDSQLDICESAFSDDVGPTDIRFESKSSSPGFTTPNMTFAPLSRGPSETSTPRIPTKANYGNKMSTLGDHELLLDSLDHETKLKLLSLLQKDLGVPVKKPTLDDPFSFEDLASREPELALDKLQSFLIISIKLLIIGFKLIIPASKYIYIRFQNNQMYFFNKKNMNKIFDLIMWFMRSLEAKFEDNEEFIDRVYNHEFSIEDPELNEAELTVIGSFTKFQQDSKKHLDILVRQVSDKATSMIDKHIQKSLAAESNNSWKRAALEYAWTNYLHTGKENHNYMEDPRYSIYFSNRNTNKDSLRSNASSPFGTPKSPANSSTNASPSVSATPSQAGTSPLEMSRSNSFGSNPKTASTDSLQELSMFRIAERFVDEIG